MKKSKKAVNWNSDLFILRDEPYHCCLWCCNFNVALLSSSVKTCGMHGWKTTVNSRCDDYSKDVFCCIDLKSMPVAAMMAILKSSEIVSYATTAVDENESSLGCVIFCQGKTQCIGCSMYLGASPRSALCRKREDIPRGFLPPQQKNIVQD